MDSNFSHTTRNLILKIVKTVLLAMLAVLMVIPVVWMLSASFKFEADVFGFPIQWIPENATLQNYEKAITDFPYFNWYINTLRNTIFIVCGMLLTSSMAGFSFAKLNFKGKNIIFLVFVAALMIPGEMRLIPQFLSYRELNILDTMWSVTLPWVLFVGFAIFFMRQAFMVVPNELIEASKIDGCGFLKIYYRICLPLVKNSLVALGILAFTWGWNDYTSPLIYLRTPENFVLSVGIASFRSQYAQNFALQMAGASMALIPIIVVYLVAQKYFITGIATAGIKG